MSQTVNLDTKYSKKIDQAFTIASLLKGRLSAENEFVGARTVRIHNINTVPLNDTTAAHPQTATASRPK